MVNLALSGEWASKYVAGKICLYMKRGTWNSGRRIGDAGNKTLNKECRRGSAGTWNAGCETDDAAREWNAGQETRDMERATRDI